MVRKHFTIDDNVLEIIDEYHKKNGISYSNALSKLVLIANDYIKIGTDIYYIREELEKIKRNNYIILKLLKQLYSDLEIDNITNPNKNDSLQLFFNKLKGENDG